MTATYARDAALVEAAANAVDLDRFSLVIRDTLEKYGTDILHFQARGMPKRRISTERLRDSSPPHNFLLGLASNTEHAYTMYVPGFARRRSQGFGIKLTALEVICHETVHTLAGEKLAEGSYRDDKVSLKARRLVFGFVEMLTIDNVFVSMTHAMLNEGMTQILALELMRGYLNRGPYMDVSSSDILRHFKQIEDWKRGSFYPEAVAYVEAIAGRLCRRLDSREEAHKKLVRAYFRAESLIHDPEWRTLLSECALHDLVHKARTAGPNDLKPVIARINAGPSRGFWDGVSAEVLNQGI